jgi:hypothetical protein
MNIFLTTLTEQPVVNRIESEDKDDTVQTRGAVPATIHQVLDRSERGLLPCNTRCLQLLFEGVQFCGCVSKTAGPG